MLKETADGLYCPAGDFYIDPWGAVERAIITHAHGDHARVGSRSYLCEASCAPLLRRRFGSEAVIETPGHGEVVHLGSTRVSFHPAGHVRGSAQVRIEGPGGVWVVSGDYKRAPDPTCPSTYSLRHLRHRIDIRSADFPLGSGFRRRRRTPRMVGRQSRGQPRFAPVLLHAR
jgi:putative mRNA 3-end processing factor